MPIAEKDVRHIASLAKLAVPDEKMDMFCSQFQSILCYMECLNSIDTTNVEPLYSPVERPILLREDKAERTAKPGEVLANAAERHETFYAVPKIV